MDDIIGCFVACFAQSRRAGILVPALRRQSAGHNESVEPSVGNCGLQSDLIGQLQQRPTVAVLDVLQDDSAKTQPGDGLEVIANHAVVTGKTALGKSRLDIVAGRDPIPGRSSSRRDGAPAGKQTKDV